ncbi:hypothetical protein K402DRAFT_465695 [Aulographum hederae CBS 113979]|uniref:Myb-like domain-containing protein n=1 Tax=Aulographum hederae CBS 113979 TaxID=1176131 RepID=A0A6G1GS94_9PEZI|nr:hypothetical protein K402DRAFT_465695 [Aulographum hederae CBS 113979]
MEPRIHALLDYSSRGRHEPDQTLSLPSIFSSNAHYDRNNALPSVRAVQSQDTSTSGAHASSNPQPQSQGARAVAARVEDASHRSRPSSTRPAKSAPLAEVLNSESPQDAHQREPPGQLSENVDDPPYNDDASRKRRKVDGTDALKLPKLPPLAKKGKKRLMIPPLLPGLHQPPPEARIFPSINSTRGLPDIADQEATTASQPPLPSSNSPKRKTNSASEKDPPSTAQETRKSAKGHKKSRQRKQWTEKETADLLKGVAKFGIGSWKKILSYEEYGFNNRTAVDLKDRFRVCRPDDYRKPPASSTAVVEEEAPNATGKSFVAGPLQLAEPILTPNERLPSPFLGPSGENDDEVGVASTERQATSSKHRKNAEDLARLGITDPFPKRERRTRREFTDEEDIALLKGYELHGPHWKAIREDNGLHLGSRSRTDLRDRFRNRYPDIFKRAGYTLKDKSNTAEANDAIGPTVDSPVATGGAPAPRGGQASPKTSAVPSSTEQDQPALAAHIRDVQHPEVRHPLNLLTSSFDYPSFELGDTRSDMATDDDDDNGPSQLTLPRNIFAWADQNPSTQFNLPPMSMSLPSTVTGSGMGQGMNNDAWAPTTRYNKYGPLSSMEQLHINPLVTLKLPPLAVATQQPYVLEKATGAGTGTSAPSGNNIQASTSSSGSAPSGPHQPQTQQTRMSLTSMLVAEPHSPQQSRHEVQQQQQSAQETSSGPWGKSHNGTLGGSGGGNNGAFTLPPPGDLTLAPLGALGASQDEDMTQRVEASSGRGLVPWESR